MSASSDAPALDLSTTQVPPASSLTSDRLKRQTFAKERDFAKTQTSFLLIFNELRMESGLLLNGRAAKGFATINKRIRTTLFIWL
jgi:hypothetical protein